MKILNQLSSQKGDKTEIANRLVAEKCIASPRLLAEIAIGLEEADKKLQSDCIEVFTLVSGYYFFCFARASIVGRKRQKYDCSRLRDGYSSKLCKSER